MLRSFIFALSFFSVVVACGGSSESTSSKPQGQTGTNGTQETPADANGCCARDTVQSGCMNLGGHSDTGSCFRSCDFFCSTNWRVEKDDEGCEYWRYDIRTPGEGETSSCQKRPVADGELDAGDAGDASAD